MRPYVTTGEMARAALVSSGYIRGCIRAGELHTHKIGRLGRHHVRIAEAVRFFQEKGFTVPAEWLEAVNGSRR